MKLRLPDSRRALSAVAVVLTIAAAAVVWQNLPTPTDVFGPFEVSGGAGTPATGRAVSATVTSVRVTPEVDSVKPAGIWVVVNAALEGTRTPDLTHCKLTVGPNTYTPSDAFSLDTIFGEVSPGLTLRGSYVFDVAPELVAEGSAAPMTFVLWAGDGRLDSELSIHIPTHGSRFSRVGEVTLKRPEMAAS